jgi:hypothetical protein
MIHETTLARDETTVDVLSALGVLDADAIVWPLPNAVEISPPAYWNLFAAGAPKVLAELGIRRVDGKACRVFATFDPAQRGGVAVAIHVGTLEPRFFTWSECAHEWTPRHDAMMSVYTCGRCGHAYRIDAEG